MSDGLGTVANKRKRVLNFAQALETAPYTTNGLLYNQQSLESYSASGQHNVGDTQ